MSVSPTSSISPTNRSSFTGAQLIPNANRSPIDQQTAQNSLNNHLNSIFYSNSHGLYGKNSNEGKINQINHENG